AAILAIAAECDVLAVRRKGNGVNVDRAVGDRERQAAALNVPNAGLTVPASRDESLTVAGERDRFDGRIGAFRGLASRLEHHGPRDHGVVFRRSEAADALFRQILQTAPLPVAELLG